MTKAFAKVDGISGHSDGTFTIDLGVTFCGAGVTGEMDNSIASANIGRSDYFSDKDKNV